MSPRGAAAAGLLVVAFALTGCGSSGTVADDPATTASTMSAAASSQAASPGAPTSEASVPAPGDVLITLDEPANGAAVSGSFKASGTANSNEANVPWRILDASGTKVLDGSFTADGWMDKLYPYTGSVDVSTLKPGTYTFVVQVDDESDGEASTPPQKVSRSITVS